MDESINIIGKVDQSGSPKVANMHEMNAFLKKYVGRDFIIKISILPNEQSDAILGYYYNKIVPDYQKIFKEAGEVMTLEAVDEKLREMSPFTVEETEFDGRYVKVLKSPRDISVRAMAQHVEYLRRIAAMEYGFEITEPKR